MFIYEVIEQENLIYDGNENQNIVISGWVETDKKKHKGIFWGHKNALYLNRI